MSGIKQSLGWLQTCNRRILITRVQRARPLILDKIILNRGRHLSQNAFFDIVTRGYRIEVTCNSKFI